MVDRLEVREKVNLTLGFTVLGITALVGLMTALQWASMIWQHRSIGVDNTDEGYYLSTVIFPHQVPHAPTDFAFYLRPLWLLSGQNLSVFRLIGFLFIVSTAVVFIIQLTRWIQLKNQLLTIIFSILSMACVVGAMSYQYVLWIPTPNYNLLGLCLLSLAASCVLALIRRGTSPPQHLGEWIFGSPFFWSGVLLFILFATRVTSFAVVGSIFIFLFFYLRLYHNARLFLVQFVWGIAASLGFHVLLTLRLPLESMRRWKIAIKLSEVRQDNYNFARIMWEYDFFSARVLPWFFWAFVLILGLVCCRVLIRWVVYRRILASLLSIVTLLTMWPQRPRGGVLAVQSEVGWWWLRMVIYTLLISALVPVRLGKRNLAAPLVALLALAGAAGSANGLYHQLIFTAGLLVVALLINLVLTIDQSGWRIISIAPECLTLIACFCVGISSARESIENPYRTVGPLSQSTELVEYGPFGNMAVHPKSAAFIRWIAAVEKSLPPQTNCVVNLEGATPIISALLHLRPAGTSWDLGAYPGSIAASEYALKLDDCWKDDPFLLIDAPVGDSTIRVPVFIAELCGPPFSSFQLQTDHKALIQASICNT